MTIPKFEMLARTPTIRNLVIKCAKKELHFDALCRLVAAMGYKTTSLHEMVRQAEEGLKNETPPRPTV